MTADADVGEAVVEFVQGDQQVVRVPELGGLVGRVAAHHEDVGDSGLAAAGHNVGQVGAVADLLGRRCGATV